MSCKQVEVEMPPLVAKFYGKYEYTEVDEVVKLKASCKTCSKTLHAVGSQPE